MRHPKFAICLLIILGLGLLLAAGLDEAMGNFFGWRAKIIAKSGEGGASDEFGFSCSIYGRFAVAGAKDNDGSGSIFVSEQGLFWSQPEKLKASDASAGDLFGYSVAIDENYIIVGALDGDGAVANSGSAYIFKYENDAWDQKDELYLVDGTTIDEFGCSVSISGDYAIVGAHHDDGDEKGSAFIFKKQPNETWLQVAKLTPSDLSEYYNFGASVAISGDYAVVGASMGDGNQSSSGAAYIFKKPAVEWIDATETAKLTASDGQSDDGFGGAVAIHDTCVIVGAWHAAGNVSDDGAAYYFQKPSGSWPNMTETDKLYAIDGESLDRFGWSVGIYRNRVAVGSPSDMVMGPGTGCVYLFKYDDGVWDQVKVLANDCAQGDYFGQSVSVNRRLVMIGAHMDDNVRGADAGAAYIYKNFFWSDRYFVHMADLHVKHDDNTLLGNASRKWEEELFEILSYRPPPAFVTVSGDMVDWGETSKGAKNYNALRGSSVLSIDNTTGISYLYDADHQIRIFFSPGNHEYYQKWKRKSAKNLKNYYSKICYDDYFHEIYDEYAIFSLNTRADSKSKDANLSCPEGKGLTDTQINLFKSDLDSLDGIINERDDSKYVKVVMMHHPHDSRRGYPLHEDGEFEKNKHQFVTLCNQYKVDYALYGHIHKEKEFHMFETGGTWCCIAEDAKDGAHMKVYMNNPDTTYQVIRDLSIINITYLGDLDTYCLEGGNRTGLVISPADTLVELGIPGSDYFYYLTENEQTGVPDIHTEILVTKDGAMDYTFEAVALNPDYVTIIVEEANSDGTSSEVWYRDVLMKHNGSKGSVATFTANSSVMNYELTITDPDMGVRTIRPQANWSVREIDLFQDTFAENGSPPWKGRIDAAVDIAPAASTTIQLGDSAVVTVSDNRFGLAPDPISGFGSAVYLYARVDPARSLLNKAVADPFRWPMVDSVSCDNRQWYLFRMDTVFADPDEPREQAVPDQFCVDLNDNYFSMGDTLWFFFGAANTMSDWSWWSQYCGTVTVMAEACEEAMEMQILPGEGVSNGGDILYVDNYGTVESKQFFNSVFERLGIEDKVDRFDKRDPSRCMPNGLGGQVQSALVQLVPYYRKIIWNSGDLLMGAIGDGMGDPLKEDDLAVLFEFLDLHDNPDGCGIYFSGNDLAEEWWNLTGPYAGQLRRWYMPYVLESSSHILDQGRSPLVIGEDGGLFDAGSPMEEDTIVAYGGAPDVHDFDVLSPWPGRTTKIEMTYRGTGLPSDGAVLSFDTLNAVNGGKQVRVVLSGFSFHYVYDDIPGGIPDRLDHLKDILIFLGDTIDDPTPVVAAPVYWNSLSQNYPNPFNPATRIHYSIAIKSQVSLKIYNVAGQLVKTLVNEVQTPKIEGYTVDWNGRSNADQPVASGIYFYRLVAKNYTRTKKMVLLK